MADFIFGLRNLGEVFLIIIFLILSLSSVLVVADAVGFLPTRVSRWLNRNRIQFALELLKDLGVVVEQQPAGARRAVPFQGDYIAEAAKFVSSCTVPCPVDVGLVEHKRFEAFADVMGRSVDPRSAELAARLLATHMRRATRLVDKRDQPTFDFIACPKAGSPILAYEFAKLVQRPLALYCQYAKFRSDGVDFKAHFDFGGAAPTRGARCLAMDDSSTGGRLMLGMIEELRDYGYEVSDCIILFEPRGKGAREKLKEEGVTLYAVVPGPMAVE